MRTPRSQIKQQSSSRRQGLFVTCGDVLWWAKVNNREPFNSAANEVRAAGGRAKCVLWRNDNTMELVLS